MNDSPLITLKNITKTYSIYDDNIQRIKETFHPLRKKYHRNKKVLDNITLNFYKHEIVGILGKNGAGKSTLLKIISEIIKPSSGEIITNGKVSALIELGASFNPDYTGHENIYFYCMTQGLSTEEVDEIYENICSFADIGEYIHQPVKYYSSGMFARLAFSAAINLVPKILIVDEILSVGDVFFQQKCMLKMRELIKNGSTILFVSHDLHAIKFFCDRAIYIQDGKIKLDSHDVVSVLDVFEKGEINQTIQVEKEISLNSHFVNVLDTIFTDNLGKEKRSFKLNETISIKITFQINQDNLDYFIGFGMRNHDGIYVFGANTKLDGIKVPSKIGTYTILLTFENQNLYKGVFNTWSVIYNNEGTILLSQLLLKNAFEISNRTELCEGIINLNRSWILAE
jgi:teichoic acid transport system ATP-binding protein